MDNVTNMNEPDVVGTFDSLHNIFFVHYKGKLTAETTTKAYGWLIGEGPKVGLENTRAFVFDFTQVTRFERDNTIATKKQSQTVHAAIDLSRIPAALVVKNMSQEQFVLLSMRINAVEERTKIVRSHKEAIKFIDEFHAKLQAKDKDNSEDE